MSNIILFVTLLVLCGFFTLTALVLDDDDDEKLKIFVGWFSFFCWVYIIILCFCGVFTKKPEAIDVYRGNTTLEITYRDTIPVDTVVIFK